MVHAEQINETTTLCLPKEEEWMQDTSEDNDLGYMKNILSCREETPVHLKELINKGYAKRFQQGLLELHNGLIFY